MNATVTIDPRLHDAVIFDLDGVVTDTASIQGGVPAFESTVALVRKLSETGVAIGVYSSSRNCEQILKEAGVEAGRNGGFSLVIGVDRTSHAKELMRSGADVVVADLAAVAVRTGDKRMSSLPNALDSYG